MYKIIGKTYDARNELKAVGYKFDGKNWFGASREPFDALIAKWRKPGYSVRMAKLSDMLDIVEADAVISCEI